MKTIRVAINGFGRIGRAFLKLAITRSDIEIVAINDLGSPENFAYLLSYDSVYGTSDLSIEAGDGWLKVNGVKIPFLNEKDPALLPWKEYDVDVALESTGFFADYEKARAHLYAGAKRVVISSPVNGEAPVGIVAQTILMGVNDDKLQVCDISSNASCTTNAGSPVLGVLKETIGVERALLNTVHGYTASQSLVDAPHHKDPRRGRAAAVNIIPSSTGAAVATTKAHEDLAGKFDGIALRVPVLIGSIADITFVASRDTTVAEVNEIFTSASKEDRWKGILSVTSEPVVSSDIVGNTHASIVDLSFTRVVGNLVKVLAWYDNEMGYTNTLVEHVIKTGGYTS
jgi:glyceraldehyde 3-phosphate dehydrogenase